MLERVLMGIIFIILPLAIVGAILVGSVSLAGQGINYWTEISGVAHDKSVDFALQSLGQGTVIYPEFIRPSSTQKLEVEFTSSTMVAAGTVLSVTVREADSFLVVTPTVLTTTLTSTPGPVPLKFDVATRNPQVPPKRVDIDVEVYDAIGQRLGHAPVPLTVNAWTGKIVSIGAILGGILGVLLTVLGILTAARTLLPI